VARAFVAVFGNEKMILARGGVREGTLLAER
jgi:exopolyphosphatase/pppGpp-phosphohydrolase